MYSDDPYASRERGKPPSVRLHLMLGWFVVIAALVVPCLIYFWASSITTPEADFRPARRSTHRLGVDFAARGELLQTVRSSVPRVDWEEPRHEEGSVSVFGNVRPRFGRMDDGGGGLVRLLLVADEPGTCCLSIETASRLWFSDGLFGDSVSRDIRARLTAQGFKEVLTWHVNSPRKEA